MRASPQYFKQKSTETLHDLKIQENLAGLYPGFHEARIKASSDTEDWDQLKERGRRIKAHTLDHLDYYLELLEKNVTNAGGVVVFADTAKDASEYVTKLAKSRGVKSVVKSKSMLSEEMSLNHHLEIQGIEPIETDLGEYIVQLAGETPYHIIAPAIHKSSEEVAALFSEKIGTEPTLGIEDLTEVARKQLREKFISADMGITGGNFMVADTGTLALVTNEGNGRMCTSMPRIHVAIVGMEKVIPSITDLGLFLRLLIRSATGQWISSYVTTVSGPKRSKDIDGPEEFHLVIVDNGRSRILADPVLRESLYCLRCGACLNACPVYRKVGGHSYGWVYPGPIGAVISPMLTGLSRGKDLPFASTLCGSCKEACPVKIDIPKMLLYLRNQLSEGTHYRSERTSGLLERAISMFCGRLLGNQNATAKAVKFLGKVLKIFPERIFPFLQGWTRFRDLPEIPEQSFVERWRDSRHIDNVDGGGDGNSEK